MASLLGDGQSRSDASRIWCGNQSNQRRTNTYKPNWRNDTVMLTRQANKSGPVVRLALLAHLLSLLADGLVASGQAVEQWGVYEVALKGPTNGNPFLNVR